MLVHYGRVSGATYRTPLDAFPVAGGYLFVPVYGSRSDRVRNIVAAGRVRLRVDGIEIELRAPRLIGRAESDEALPAEAARPPRLGITQFHRTDTVEAAQS